MSFVSSSLMKNEKNSSVKGSLRVVWCHLVVRNITGKKYILALQ